MFQVLNQTPFVPGIFLFPDEQGVDTLYVLLKATFAVHGADLRMAEEQCPLVLADEYLGEPGRSSLKRATEAHLMKPGTDVLLLGEAHAPDGRAVDSCSVSLRVGPLQQTLKVSGHREWRGGWVSPRPSTPEPFTTIPLVWERAFGGMHEREGQVLAEPRNPVGQGFRGRRSGSDMLGRPLPNIEDPRNPIRSISDDSSPVGVGPIAPAWEPRRSCAGTYDDAWRTRRAPYLPENFRPEFFCLAPPPLHSQEGLEGGEPVELLNVTPEGVQRFTLPRCELEVTVRMAGKSEKPRLRLETVLLEPSHRRVCLTWRGAVNCDKRALKVREARYALMSLQGVEP